MDAKALPVTDRAAINQALQNSKVLATVYHECARS
jgi:hypothetical protein